MANWSQSHFLQSLGWATLNSFWQMALLWCFYLAVNYLFKLNAENKYRFSVTALVAGFAWFVFTFFHYYQSSSISTIAFFNQSINHTNNILNLFLFAASVTYLALLIFPSIQLFKNWQFVQRIKKQGLQKAGLNHRLFVQKMSLQLGITKKVMVYVSELVKSPMTVGYLKPIILLPFAVLSNLSTQQVEAILLHELSHIKRYDYLVNLVMSFITTVLYFNPFVKQFMKTIEEERENCCDQLVLQFEYDNVAYASALLTLEKIAAQFHVLTLCATGKKYLLSRIEKIIGMPAGQSNREKKRRFKLNHLAFLFAALFCIFIFNSVMIIKEKEKKTPGFSLAYDNLSTPFSFFNDDETLSPTKTPVVDFRKKETEPQTLTTTNLFTGAVIPYKANIVLENQPVEFPLQQHLLMNVAQDDIDANLTSQQKEEIKSTVAATKKIFTDLQWKEIDKTIADVMTENEKLKAKEVYLKSIEKTVNFKNIEQQLKANYENIDWNKINFNIEQGLSNIQLDSLKKLYTQILVQLEKAKNASDKNEEVVIAPIPDQSVNYIRRSTEVMRMKVDSIKAIQSPKKIVRL